MPLPPPRRHIERALLAYVLLVIAVLTLSPFQFAWPQHPRVSWLSDFHDLPVNVLLFLPVGFLHRLTLRDDARRPVLRALLFGALVSLAIETTQLFLPARTTSLGDLLGNTCGALAGAVLCGAVRRRLERLLPSVLTLDHPLLNVVYLVVPLMWLTGVDSVHNSARVWLLAPLGALGALTLSGLWRYRFQRAAQMPRPALAAAILAWFLFGALTGVHAAPQVVAQCAAGIFALTLLRLYLRRAPTPPDRRFEGRVLAMVWPCYLAYLAMLVMWPHPPPYEPFDLAFGLYNEWYFNRMVATRVAEQLSALTLLGYLLAETFGRSAVPRRWLAARNLALGWLVAAVMEVGHGFLPQDRASVMRWLLGVAGVTIGVTLYGAQLNVLRVLRGPLHLGDAPSP